MQYETVSSRGSATIIVHSILMLPPRHGINAHTHVHAHTKGICSVTSSALLSAEQMQQPARQLVACDNFLRALCDESSWVPLGSERGKKCVNKRVKTVLTHSECVRRSLSRAVLNLTQAWLLTLSFKMQKVKHFMKTTCLVGFPSQGKDKTKAQTAQKGSREDVHVHGHRLSAYKQIAVKGSHRRRSKSSLAEPPSFRPSI